MLEKRLLRAVALSLVAAGMTLVADARTTPDANAAVPTPAQANAQQFVDRSVVIGKVRSLSAIAQRIDRLESKLSTFGQVMDVAAPGGWVDVAPLDAPVWVVALSGQIEPSAARGTAYPWAVFVYHAVSGVPIAVFSHDKHPWPPFFDGLADASVR